MLKKRTAGAVMLLVVLGMAGLAACSSTPSIKPTFIKSNMQGGAATISLNDVRSAKMTHFTIGTQAGNATFMAYDLNGQVYIRASVCPPCRSESFSLKGDKLVCNTCGTVFDAKTGNGVEGACVAYPKQSVTYQVNGDKITADGKDLVQAYLDTLQPN